MSRPEESSPGVGYSAPRAAHKAVHARVYLANRTWLLKVSKEDAAWLGLEPGEDLVINFHNRRAHR